MELIKLKRSVGCAGRRIRFQPSNGGVTQMIQTAERPVRLTLNDDGRGLTLEVFLEDPESLCDGVSGTLNGDYTPDFENCRHDCGPEVATRFTLP